LGVAEDHDRRGDGRPHFGDQCQRRLQAAAGCERTFRSPLNHGAVSQRIGKRHTDFEDIGAAAVEARAVSAPSFADRDRRP